MDDHSLIRAGVRALVLDIPGYAVVGEASDGSQLLEMVEQLAPDIVLLDVMMPGDQDGLDVLKVVKSDPELRATLVAMVTARGQTADSEVARQHGADAYFIKPFSPLQVLSWLRAAVQ